MVYGVNHDVITPGMTVISNASCTTNCLAPMAKVLHDSFGILRGYMVTIHAYTGDQNTVDTLHKDLHRARAAAVSTIPTSTGAAKALGLVIPELAGKLDGTAIRVPTPNVSLVSLDVNLRERATVAQINDAMKAASTGALRGILDYNTAELVSVDFNHQAASCTFDATQTAVVDQQLARDHGLVRQRVGLQQPHGRHGHPVRKHVSVAVRTLDGVRVAGQRVLLRADLNVPVRDGRISDLTPDRAAVADHSGAFGRWRAGDRLQPL